MFVSGETNDPPLETTCVIEDIVRSQVAEILSRGTALARKRGARSISVEDLIFLIRDDKAKVNRLSTYLSWKEVRKNARDQDGGGVMEGADLLEDAGVMNSEAASKKLYKKASLKLPWELQFMFSEQAPDDNDEEGATGEVEEAHQSTLERLKLADERTRGMTKEEYVHWSECRQASFTFRKSKRFREWAAIGQLTDSKPSDDIIDILGFLTFEIVANLTEAALKVKEREDELSARLGYNDHHVSKKRKKEHRLFDGPDDQQSPILARHIQEAFRKFQEAPLKATSLRGFTGGLVRQKCRII